MSQVVTESELTPSDITRAEPAFARILGMFGLGFVVLGSAAVIANQFGPRWIPESGGYLCIVLGLAAMAYHAVRDGDLEIRRLYGLLAAILLAVSLIVSLIPGPLGEPVSKAVGYYLLPWGVASALLALVFAIPFIRHEDYPPYQIAARTTILVIGGLLCIGSVITGMIRPESLVGFGLVLALLGYGFLIAYLGATETTEGRGYQVAIGLGILGGIALILAIGLSVVPTVLHEGPAALKTPRQTYDIWKVLARVVIILLGFSLSGFAIVGRIPTWLRGALLILGLAWAAVFIVGSFMAPLAMPPKSYLIPYGILLAGIGLLYLLTAIASTDDTQLVVLTRRELAAYFYSPIAYIVLFGMAFFASLGYAFFLLQVLSRRQPLPEPILQDYMSLGILGAFQVVFLVPALTMRLFSEERRTGTLEVLFTAPVSESAVVLAKFLGAWLFYLLCWVPAGAFLIGLRTAGGKPFDYLPLLSFYLAAAAAGTGFVAMGLFFSALTRNQIVSAVLTFAAMMFLLLTVLARSPDVADAIGSGLAAVLARLDFLTLWSKAVAGQLLIQDVFTWLTLAVFWLFLTIKVLEARKWS